MMKTCLLIALIFLAVGSKGNDECADTFPADHHPSKHVEATDYYAQNKEYLDYYGIPTTQFWDKCTKTCSELAQLADGKGCYYQWTDLYCSATPEVKVMDTCKITCKTCCSDGIQNQGEEGVDCGGPCEPCKAPTDCKWGDWEYGECSMTCGGGKRTNYRKILVHQSNGGKACTGSTWETQDCNTESCPAECLDSLVAEQDPSKCLEDNGKGLKHDNDCLDCSKPPKQGCADGYLMNSSPHGKCTKITCTQVPGHNPSKCLEDKGQGLKPDNDCINCMKPKTYRPPKQGCADGYVMNSSQHGRCTRITCTLVPGHDPSKCLEDNGKGLKHDNDCLDCSKPPKQGCADGFIMNSSPHGRQHDNPRYAICTKITCTKPCQ